MRDRQRSGGFEPVGPTSKRIDKAKQKASIAHAYYTIPLALTSHCARLQGEGIQATTESREARGLFDSGKRKGCEAIMVPRDGQQTGPVVQPAKPAGPVRVRTHKTTPQTVVSAGRGLGCGRPGDDDRWVSDKEGGLKSCQQSESTRSRGFCPLCLSRESGTATCHERL